MPRSESHLAVPQVALIALFVTALITAQVTASKLLAFELPVSLPVAGGTLLLPGAALAYAVTFFASDCYAELYGRRAAQVMVNVAFVMNFVLLVLVWSTIYAPIAQISSVGQSEFANVLGSSTGIVAGSLLAYLVSQNWDVLVFHRIRDATGGQYLWLRNLGSTASSQLIDTVIFITVAFVIFGGMGLGTAVSLMAGQYILKLTIAVVDTPFVYLVVSLVPESDVTDALAFGS